MEAGQTDVDQQRRKTRAGKGEPTWRVVRYADDFVVLVRGERHRGGAARADRACARTNRVTAVASQNPDRAHERGVRLPRVPHPVETQARNHKWYVYTYVAKRPIRSVRDKVRALTPRTSQQDLGAVLIRINQITRGWTNYFKHAVAKHTFSHLRQFTWWRIVQMMRTRHRWRWKDVRRWLTDHGRWRPITADGIEMFNAAAVPVTRYRYRGNKIPNPWALAV